MVRIILVWHALRQICPRRICIRHRLPLPQWSKKYVFKVQSILTTINLGKSRQTNAVILVVLQESLTPILQILRR